MDPDQIEGCSLWWKGPEWLGQNHYPEQPGTLESQIAEEEIRRTTHPTSSRVSDFSEDYVRRFSSFTKLIRSTAYWMRLMRILKKSEENCKNLLTVEELEQAEYSIIRCIQQESFPAEWKALMKNKNVHRSSPLRWFTPRISSEGLICVGGRLGRSMESEDTKHPIVLPAEHPFAKMLFEYYHIKLLHAGSQLLLSTVRLKYWPLGGRNVPRQVVHNCMKCFRAKPSPIEQFMGELPQARVTVARAFLRTGVDYFGPVYIRPAPRKPAVKAYVSVIICLCTKAVQSQRRFIGRRGYCSDIYSDNETNFVGARSYLREILKLLRNDHHKEAVSKESTSLRITLGNSRPITALTDDPDNLEPPRPEHFLIGEPLQQIPERDVRDVPLNRLNNNQTLQKRIQHFWDRLRVEYLTQLQGRFKRWKTPIEIKIEQLVAIKDDNLPPSRWKMGRVDRVFPGADGVVRVVTLKTASGPFTRPVEKLCVLPASSQPDYKRPRFSEKDQ
ncbi:uncharacterized protein LOC129742241 [Uranotaenia lowii]|uniref:uncharacterized protein LOC129742241 n=1 Tax=Uranotaenia lowii TaxID=190385 RepID=UPI002479DE41|nr:uncharacterized protein LOC129742241 [Uranotaenia lowii]